MERNLCVENTRLLYEKDNKNILFEVFCLSLAIYFSSLSNNLFMLYRPNH